MRSSKSCALLLCMLALFRGVVQGQGLFEEVGNAVGQVVEDVAQGVTEGAQNLVDDIKDGVSDVTQQVGDQISGAVDGIESMANQVGDVFTTIFDDLSEYLRDAVNVTREEMDDVGDFLRTPIEQLLSGTALLNAGFGLPSFQDALKQLPQEAWDQLKADMRRVDQAATRLWVAATEQFPEVDWTPWNVTLADTQLDDEVEKAAQAGLLLIGKGVSYIGNASRVLGEEGGQLASLVRSLFTDVGTPSEAVMDGIVVVNDATRDFLGHLREQVQDSQVFQPGRRRVLQDDSDDSDDSCGDVNWDATDLSSMDSISDALVCTLDRLWDQLTRLIDQLGQPFEELGHKFQGLFDDLAGRRCVFTDSLSDSLADALRGTTALHPCVEWACQDCARAQGDGGSSKLVLDDCGLLGSTSQQFTFKPAGDTSDVFTVQSKSEGLCLTAEEGEELRFSDCSDSESQQWWVRELETVFRGKDRFVLWNPVTEKCAHAKDDDDGSNFELRQCKCGTKQVFAASQKTLSAMLD